MAKSIENIRRIVSGEVPAPPVATLIGLQCRAVVELEAEPRHANPMGTLHGGILCDVADAAMGIAYASELEEGESFMTLELKINFFKPVWKAKLRAVGRIVERAEPLAWSSATSPTRRETWSAVHRAPA